MIRYNVHYVSSLSLLTIKLTSSQLSTSLQHRTLVYSVRRLRHRYVSPSLALKVVKIRNPEPLTVDYHVFSRTTDKRVDPCLTVVTINGSKLQVEIDTGSTLTLISQTIFAKLWPDISKAPHLETWGGFGVASDEG